VTIPMERTELVARAIMRWIRENHQGDVGSTLTVREGAHEELSSGHVVQWEGGTEDWVYNLTGGGYVSRTAAFMGCYIEAVNHFTLAVYEMPRDVLHKDHDIRHAHAGAPGTGYRITCVTCDEVLEDTIRVMEPWETR